LKTQDQSLLKIANVEQLKTMCNNGEFLFAFAQLLQEHYTKIKNTSQPSYYFELMILT
jgi:hypothetical protein